MGSRYGSISSWQEAVTLATTTYSNALLIILPKILGAFIILLVGKIISNAAKALIHKLSKVTGIAKVLDIAGLDDLLEKLGFEITIANFLGVLAYWSVMLVFFVAAVDVLGLPAVSSLHRNVLSYIPKVIGAILILALGLVIANITNDLLVRSLKATKIKAAKLLGSIAKSVIIVFVSLAAVSELGVAQDFMRMIFAGVVFALSLGLGLAIGLGCKDLVKEMAGKWYKKVS